MPGLRRHLIVQVLQRGPFPVARPPPIHRCKLRRFDGAECRSVAVKRDLHEAAVDRRISHKPYAPYRDHLVSRVWRALNATCYFRDDVTDAIVAPDKLDPLSDGDAAFHQPSLRRGQRICRGRQTGDLTLRRFGLQLAGRLRFDLVCWQMTFDTRPPAHAWFFLAPITRTREWCPLLCSAGWRSCRNRDTLGLSLCLALGWLWQVLCRSLRVCLRRNFSTIRPGACCWRCGSAGRRLLTVGSTGRWHTCQLQSCCFRSCAQLWSRLVRLRL
eukprot:COSAG03_NODE_1925_length_3351_cov_1.838561_3_plen_271_part_00